MDQQEKEAEADNGGFRSFVAGARVSVSHRAAEELTSAADLSDEDGVAEDPQTSWHVSATGLWGLSDSESTTVVDGGCPMITDPVQRRRVVTAACLSEYTYKFSSDFEQAPKDAFARLRLFLVAWRPLCALEGTVRLVRTSDTLLVVAADADTLYMVFRGTRTKADMRANIGVRLSHLPPLPPHCKGHRGFIGRAGDFPWGALRGEVLRGLTAGKRVVFGGHSLGGAIACIKLVEALHDQGVREVSAEHPDALTTVTFSCPFVFNAAASEHLTSSGAARQIHNFFDPTDRVPTSSRAIGCRPCGAYYYCVVPFDSLWVFEQFAFQRSVATLRPGSPLQAVQEWSLQATELSDTGAACAAGAAAVLALAAARPAAQPGAGTRRGRVGTVAGWVRQAGSALCSPRAAHVQQRAPPTRPPCFLHGGTLVGDAQWLNDGFWAPHQGPWPAARATPPAAPHRDPAEGELREGTAHRGFMTSRDAWQPYFLWPLTPGGVPLRAGAGPLSAPPSIDRIRARAQAGVFCTVPPGTVFWRPAQRLGRLLAEGSALREQAQDAAAPPDCGDSPVSPGAPSDASSQTSPPLSPGSPPPEPPSLSSPTRLLRRAVDGVRQRAAKARLNRQGAIAIAVEPHRIQVSLLALLVLWGGAAQGVGVFGGAGRQLWGWDVPLAEACAPSPVTAFSEEHISDWMALASPAFASARAAAAAAVCIACARV